MQDQALSVQEQMMELVKRVNRLQVQAVSGQERSVISQLADLARDLEDLRSEFPAMREYVLTISGVDMPEDQNVVETVLPEMFGDLAVAGKAKLVRDRSPREIAAINLLPVAIEEALEGGYGKLPRIMPRQVAIHMQNR